MHEGLTLRVVLTLLLPFVCPAPDAVTVVVFVPDVWPLTALTVRVTGLLVAPAARVTDEDPSVDALKFAVLLSVAASV